MKRNSWHGFRHYFLRDLALRRKFIVINLLALTVTLVMSMLILYHIRRVIVNDSIRSGEALVTQTASALEAGISSVVNVSESVTSVQFLNRMIYSPDPEEFISSDEGRNNAVEYCDYIRSLIDQRLITDICIYLASGYRKICETFADREVFYPMEKIRSSYWHGIFNGRPGLTELMCPDFYLTRWESGQHGEVAYIREFMTETADNREPAAYIAVYFSRAYLEELLKENRMGDGSVSYLINSRENIAASSDASVTAVYYISYNSIPDIIEGTSFAEATVLDQELYMAYRDIEGTDWRLVSAIPRGSIYSEGRLFTRLAGVYVTAILLSVILQLILSASLSARIVGITKRIGEQKPIPLENGPPDRDEIGQLVDTYNSMLDRLSVLAREQTETAEKLKVSEVRALQAQINPHFLYNMLDMINWLAIAGNRDGVSQAVRSLSRYYKLTLSKKDIMVSLGEELEHVELYAGLQNMRFEEKIHFLVDVPDELMDCQIPKLVLQPVVENAIIHGIFEKENREGTVVITAWEEPSADKAGSDLVLAVSDDGVGIPPEKLPGLLGGGNDDKGGYSGNGTNIAIYNTHHRLNLLYGPEYGLSFSSVYGEGTEVHIRIKKTEGNSSE